MFSDSKAPLRASEGSAGFDLYSHEYVIVDPWSRMLVDTGIAMAIPAGYCGIIHARSSMALKGIDIAGGVIDSDYRGNIKVILVNNSNSEICVWKDERIAQIVISPILSSMLVTDELTPTVRGTSGFGSSGAK